MAIEDFLINDKARENGGERVFEFGELTFVKLLDQEPLQFELLKKYDGVIIEYSRQAFTIDMIRAFRSHEEESIHLMPLFLYKSYGEHDDILSELLDGTLERLNDLGGIAETTILIQKRLSS